MRVEIIEKSLTLRLHGFSGTVTDKDYVGTAFKLMDRMWQIVKSNHLKNKGLNTWVYEASEKMFAGVELDNAPDELVGLEFKEIVLPKYAYFKHVGPYNLIKQSGQNMTIELNKKGFQTVLPYIEIYGHWHNNESKLETELLMSIV